MASVPTFFQGPGLAGWDKHCGVLGELALFYVNCRSHRADNQGVSGKWGSIRCEIRGGEPSHCGC